MSFPLLFAALTGRSGHGLAPYGPHEHTHNGAEMTVDLDSTVCEAFGKSKHGAAYGHTGVLGYHPLAAVRDDTGEVVHARMRSGSSQRGHLRFAAETLARLARLAPAAAVTVRADAGFFSYEMVDRLRARGARYSITVPHNAKVKAAIAGIDDNDWASIAYTDSGEAQVAETTITTGRRDSQGPRRLRLVVRRTRLPEGPQRELWPHWRHHAFITDRDDLDAEAADAYHRAHARVELAIRDLKDNGLAHCPSGNFCANAAHLGCAALAHNLARWCARLAHATHPHSLTTSAGVRRRLLAVCGRLVNHSGRHRLRMPAHWPWATNITQALRHIRNLPCSSERAPRPGAPQHTHPKRHKPAKTPRHQPHTPRQHPQRTHPPNTGPQTPQPATPTSHPNRLTGGSRLTDCQGRPGAPAAGR